MPGSWRRIAADAKALVEAMGRNDLGSYAAALSYNFIFALFPLLLFVSAGLSFIRMPASVLADGPLAAFVPGPTWRVVMAALGQALRQRNAYALWFGLLLFLYGMSGAFRQFMDAVNRIYGFPYPWRRPVWLFYLQSFGLALTVGVGAIVAIALSVVEPVVLRAVFWGRGGGGPELAVVDGLRWILLLAVFLVLLSLLYWVAPDRRGRFRLITPGALAMLLAWAVLSSGFSYYVAHFAHYNVIYGTLGQIILLLLYLYLFGLLLLFGVQVNAYADGAAPGPPRTAAGP
jgi:membrane protein